MTDARQGCFGIGVAIRSIDGSVAGRISESNGHAYKIGGKWFHQDEVEVAEDVSGESAESRAEDVAGAMAGEATETPSETPEAADSTKEALIAAAKEQMAKVSDGKVIIAGAAEVAGRSAQPFEEASAVIAEAAGETVDAPAVDDSAEASASAVTAETAGKTAEVVAAAVSEEASASAVTAETAGKTAELTSAGDSAEVEQVPLAEDATVESSAAAAAPEVAHSELASSAADPVCDAASSAALQGGEQAEEESEWETEEETDDEMFKRANADRGLKRRQEVDPWRAMFAWICATVAWRFEEEGKAATRLRDVLKKDGLEAAELTPESLCDGKILYALVFALRPEDVKKPIPNAPGRLMQVTQLCKKLGVKEMDLFSPPDIMEAPPKNPAAVLRCLTALANITKGLPDFSGPKLKSLFRGKK